MTKSDCPQLTLTALPGIPLIQPGDDLAEIVIGALARASICVQAGDVLVLAQKIVSKAEGRLVRLSDITPSAEAVELARAAHKDPRQVQVVLSESKGVVRHRPGVIVVEHRLGYVCANGGVDHSNVEPPKGVEAKAGDTWLLMLPQDPDRSAALLRRRFQEASGVDDLGVIINDSHGRAWRTGTVGVALGVAGFPALLDLRGRPDLFDHPLEVTTVGLADEVAAAASLLMGQAGEGRPAIHVRGIPYPLREGSARELIRSRETDLFR